ncbi:MAG: hypothetical protein KKF00_04235 [Proteobacteria bacterium]|nr:hypothetical protein [Pseudomonadota bacterium]
MKGIKKILKNRPQTKDRNERIETFLSVALDGSSSVEERANAILIYSLKRQKRSTDISSFIMIILTFAIVALTVVLVINNNTKLSKPIVDIDDTIDTVNIEMSFKDVAYREIVKFHNLKISEEFDGHYQCFGEIQNMGNKVLSSPIFAEF